MPGIVHHTTLLGMYKDTVILVSEKTYHGNQIIEAESSIMRLLLKYASIHVPGIHSPVKMMAEICSH